MLSPSSTNRKRSALSSIANVDQNSNNNNHKRIKLDQNQNQNISSISCKRTNVALSSIANVHHNNKRIKLCSESQVNSQLSDCSTANRPLRLNHLPFDCLSSIFDCIPLQHRITRLSLVCHQWKSTVEEMCHLKGQLTINLFSSYKPRVLQLATSDLEHYWANVRHERVESLLLKNRNCLIPDLSHRFPLVTQLVIRSNDTTQQHNRASLKLFCGLLSGQPQEWCASLTSLTLYKMTKITDPTFLPELCSMINRKFNQSNLKQLNLYIYSFGPVTRQTYHPERVELRKVLPNLERFFVDCTFQNWPSVMRILGDPTRTKGVKELKLNESSLSLDNWTSCILSQTQLTSTVTHLHLLGVWSREWFSLVCESFGLLKFLQIDIGNNKFDASWFAILRKLPHLTELKMHRFQLDPTVQPVPLSTINKLTICERNLLAHFRASTDSNRFNADHFCRLLSHHFPSVSRLILISNEKMRVTMAERNIRKWAQVHFKQIEKVVLVLKAVEFANDMKWRWKFTREYRKLSAN